MTLIVFLYFEFKYIPHVRVQSLSHVQHLCDPMNYSLPGSSVRGILQGRILELLPFPSPGNLPDPGIKHESPALQEDFFTIWASRAAYVKFGRL